MKTGIRTVTGILMIVYTGCSVCHTRFYAEPSNHAVALVSSTPGRTAYNPRYSRFESRPVPSIFRDSVDGVTVSLRLLNAYDRIRIGPPLIPLVPFRTGYGFPSDKIPDPIDSDTCIEMELEITVRNEVAISFSPTAFRIESSNGPIRCHAIALNDTIIGTKRVLCHAGGRWRIRFLPGIRIELEPVVFLTSLTIDGRSFYPDGIRFKKGKRSFYSPLIMVNG